MVYTRANELNGRRSPKELQVDMSSVVDMDELESPKDPLLEVKVLRRMTPHSRAENQRNGLILLTFMGLGLSILFFIYSSLPPIENGNFKWKMPRNFDELRAMHKVLSLYTKDHYYHVLVGLAVFYMFLQIFAVPGSIFLNLLTGALFGVKVGFPVVNVVSTIGASLCYLMSSIVGRGLIGRLFPGYLANFQARVEGHRSNMFNYLLFLRISPLLPNWFINIASPVLNVPFSSFFAATFFGLMPANFIAIKAGLDLSKLNSTGEVVPVSTLFSLLGLAVLAMVPGLLKHRIEKYLS